MGNLAPDALCTLVGPKDQIKIQISDLAIRLGSIYTVGRFARWCQIGMRNPGYGSAL